MSRKIPHAFPAFQHEYALSLVNGTASLVSRFQPSFPSQHALVRTSKPRGHVHMYDSRMGLDLTLLRITRGNAGSC